MSEMINNIDVSTTILIKYHSMKVLHILQRVLEIGKMCMGRA